MSEVNRLCDIIASEKSVKYFYDVARRFLNTEISLNSDTRRDFTFKVSDQVTKLHVIFWFKFVENSKTFTVQFNLPNDQKGLPYQIICDLAADSVVLLCELLEQEFTTVV
jgi:hypothetical protein